MSAANSDPHIITLLHSQAARTFASAQTDPDEQHIFTDESVAVTSVDYMHHNKAVNLFGSQKKDKSWSICARQHKICSEFVADDAKCAVNLWRQ